MSFQKLLAGALVALGIILAVILVTYSGSSVAANSPTTADRENILVRCERGASPRECWIELAVDPPEPGRDNMASAVFVTATDRLEVGFWWAPARPNANGPFGPARAESFRFGITEDGGYFDLGRVQNVRWVDSHGRIVKVTSITTR